MKINYLKINGFGKLENKEIELNKKINIIKGNNEAGKSTLLNFIASSLYGISKTKNGKDMSTFDRYKPWSGLEFSGKIKYELDNKDEYEIYRDFRKKAPQIYQNGRDVSFEYGVDKSKGSEFFTEQTGITEEMFFNTFLSEQEGVKLNKNSQNSIIQRLSNIVSTGNENVSFKKTVDKINKKQLEEIGTERSSGRPINIVDSRIEVLQDEIKEIDSYKNRKYELEQEKNNLSTDIEESKNVLELLRKTKKIKEKNTINNEKVKILDNEIDGYSEMQESKREEIKKLQEEKQEKKKSNKLVYLILLLLAIVIVILATILKKNLIYFAEILVLIVGIIVFAKDKKNKNRIRANNRKYKEKLEKLNEDIERLEQIKNLKLSEVSKIESELEENEMIDNKAIVDEFKDRVGLEQINEVLSTKYEAIVDLIAEKEEEVSNYKVSERTMEVTNEDIIKNLENLVCLEEELESLYEEKEELENKNNIYNLVKESLEEAYEEMKSNITPDFIIEIQNIVSDATGGKYNKCIVDEEGIKIEVENGSYVGIERLSVGTIDLIYLALRLSAAKSMSDEKIPIILDEAFAYYDKNRMRNILNYLNEKYDNQVIIFTCTEREIELLKEDNIDYNLVVL